MDEQNDGKYTLSLLNFKMYEYLTSVTLADLVDKQLKKLGGDVAVLNDARRLGTRARFKPVEAPAA